MTIEAPSLPNSGSCAMTWPLKIVSDAVPEGGAVLISLASQDRAERQRRTVEVVGSQVVFDRQQT